MKKLAIVLSFITLVSCNNEEDFTNKSEVESILTSNYSEDTKLKTKFAKALAKAVNENQNLREFIKVEALKKRNKDYDVIYHLVKNVDINSNLYLRTNSTSTLHNVLIPYFENEQELINIENSLPLLTIFVPDLQEGSFSAENWDTSSQIPLVGVRSYETDDVKLYGTDVEFNLEAQYMPDFPVLVVKDNERIISNVTSSQFNNLNTNIITDASDLVQLRFLDNNYDSSIIIRPNTQNTSSYPRVDPIHQNAYNVYSNYTPGGWQRDYIYYGLTPTNTEGGINPTYREYLTSFKLTGNAIDAYNYISSSQDPRLRFSYIRHNQTGWTDGSYEIGITLNYGAKNSNMGTTIKKGFGASPNELFNITYVRMNGLAGALLFKRIQSISLKTIDFMNNPNNKIEFPVWDLNNFSNQWKIEFEEVDTPITHTSTVSASNKFNMNFSLEPSTGILKKMGLKLGASYEQTQTNTYVMQYTDISDDLKHSDINFYDNVVDMNNANQLVPRKYNTGKVEFEFRPRLVY
jgi:hypothetical protein